jgi:molybdate transport system substrate-binding protein
LARLLPGLAAFVIALAGCSATPTPKGQHLTILLAASLLDALAEVAEAYEAHDPETTLSLVAGSSAALRVQIEQGAPADVYLAADTINPRVLAEAGLVLGQPRPFASNRFAIVVPLQNPAGIESLADLARPGVRIVAAGPQVPISRYSAELLRRAQELPGFQPDLLERYQANVVSREDDVRAALAKVELGEGDAAIVYRTDARASSSVLAVELPPELEVAATYAGVVVSTSQRAEPAAQFLDWLIGPDGQRVLQRYGFLSP